MRLKSLRSKLIVSVAALVIGSGLIISLVATNRFSKSLREANVVQGEYLSKALALEAIDRILLNDVIALQNLLKHQLKGNPTVRYLFVVKEGQILAHTFAEGIPVNLIGINRIKDHMHGNFRRIVTDTGLHYLDIAWPIFSGKAGVLRVGLSEESYRQQISRLWIRMIAITAFILLLSLGISLFFIRRVTQPLTKLVKITDKISKGNLELQAEPAGQDEIGRLTRSFNQMIRRIRDYTNEIKKNSMELDRAHRQTISAFEMIQKIWTQDNLKDVSSYLILKFQAMIACNTLVLFIFSGDKETLFIFVDGKIKTIKRKFFESSIAMLSQLNGFEFMNKNFLNPQLVPDAFHSATQIATFPIHYENQMLGALLIPCPNDCRCSAKELEVIRLILKHASGTIKRAVSKEEERRTIQKQINAATAYCGIVGKDPKMQSIYQLIENVALTDTTVLIQGESGTGKELVAGAIHQQSLRKNKPFIVINCSAYPATLLESELFGHEKGSFTGAVRQKAGRFEQAKDGIVFLDEIGEIPPSAQIKLLRVLQTQKLERVGGETTLSLNVRILAATNKNLLEEVKKGNFREDLYYRLNVILMNLPPLRNRRNDIPLLTRYFMQRFAHEQGKEIVQFSPGAMRLLFDYSWPGNVRELENCVEHAVVLARENRIEISDLPTTIQKASPDGKAETQITMMENEARLLSEVLEGCNWNKKETAKRLGISRNTLYRKLKKYQIHPPTIH